MMRISRIHWKAAASPALRRLVRRHFRCEIAFARADGSMAYSTDGSAAIWVFLW